METVTTLRRRARIDAALGAARTADDPANVADVAAMLARHAAALAPADDAADLAADAMASVLDPASSDAVRRLLVDYADPANRGRAVAYGRQLVRTLASNARRAATVADDDDGPADVRRAAVGAALDADGPAERADRDDNGRRIRDAETFAGILGGEHAARPYRDDADADDQTAARADAVKRARRPWETPREQTTPRAVRILRERSLEDLLAASRIPWGNRPGRDYVDAAGVHAGYGSTDDADRVARGTFGAYFWDAPATADADDRDAARILTALDGRPFGRFLAEHYSTTTGRGKAGTPTTGAMHPAQGRRAIRALSDDDPATGQPVETPRPVSRLDLTAALRALDLPTSGRNRAALRRLAAEHAATAARYADAARTGAPAAWHLDADRARARWDARRTTGADQDAARVTLGRRQDAARRHGWDDVSHGAYWHRVAAYGALRRYAARLADQDAARAQRRQDAAHRVYGALLHAAAPPADQDAAALRAAYGWASAYGWACRGRTA